MDMQTKFHADLTVRSFAYVANQLARSSEPSVHYDQILREAERHCSALRLVERDAVEMAAQALREQKLTKAEFQRWRAAAAQTVATAQAAITRTAAKYAPHKLAAKVQRMARLGSLAKVAAPKSSAIKSTGRVTTVPQLSFFHSPAH